jgi:hypothetical protein
MEEEAANVHINVDARPEITAEAIPSVANGMPPQVWPPALLQNPAAPTLVTPLSVALYDAKAVYVAAFWGSPIAGSVIMAMNYKRTGQSQAAFKAIGIGLLIEGIMTIIACVGTAIPQPIWLGVSVALASVYRQQAKTLQGPMVSAHLQAGGKKGSPWAAFGIALLCLLLYLVIFGAIYIVYSRI